MDRECKWEKERERGRERECMIESEKEREREAKQRQRESRPKATTSNSAKQMFYIRWQLPAGGATNEALGEHIKLERGNNNSNNKSQI